MNQIHITCPSCGFSRQVPAERVPTGSCKITCPRCKAAFPFNKPASPPLPSEPERDAASGAGVQPPPQPPQPPRSASPAPEPEPTAETLPPPSAEQLMTAPLQSGRPRRERPAPPKVLPDIGTLFGRSWTIFQQRFATLIGLYLLSMVAFIIPPSLLIGVAILGGVAKGGVVFVALGAIGALAGLYLGFSCFGAFLHAVVDDRLTIGEALGKGRTIVLALLWVGLLTGFIIGGGFLLFIIPGVIFLVWFFFAQFIVVAENLHGMDALLKSKEYVRDEWFNVALRLLLVWAAYALLGAIPLAGPILTIVFLPYVMIFHFLLYRDLFELKGDIPYSCGTGDLLKWPAIALVGFIIVPTAVVLLVGGAAMGKLRQISTGSVTISRQGTTTPPGTPDSQGYRVIDFPQKDASGSSPAAAGGNLPAAQPDTLQPPPVATEEIPDNIHIFIYAVNYTGTVRANGTNIKELEGKPEVQYSYNLGGTGLKYGENRIDLDYSELPAHNTSLLEVHMKISRNAPGRGKEILGEWRLNEKGSGTRSYTLTIPKL